MSEEPCTCEDGEYPDILCPEHGEYSMDDIIADAANRADMWDRLMPKAHCDHCTPEHPCPPRCVLCAAEKLYGGLRRKP